MRIAAACFLLVVTACSVSSPSRIRRKTRLKSFAERYVLPANVHTITANLPLAFGYRFTDDHGTTQSREEKTEKNGSKTGSYSFVDAAGLYRRVEYVADRHGFRATVTTNEPGTLSVDPAHVRMLTETDRISHETPNSPQLEYSSHVFSKYNFSESTGDKKKVTVLNDHIFLSEPNRDPVKPKAFDITLHKGGPVTFSPGVASLLQDLEDPLYRKPPNSNLEKFFDDSLFSAKIFNVRKVPTRYPRKPRTRAKKRAALKIHIPKGYEGHHDLPLYRDK